MTLRLTAQHADIWHGFGKPEELAHKNAGARRLVPGGSGRDPGEIERSGGVPSVRFGDPSYGDALLAAGTRSRPSGWAAPPSTWPSCADWVAWRDERNEGA